MAVNDGAVMKAWAKDQGTEGGLLKLYGDPGSEVTRALGLVLDHPGVMAVLGNPRCKRFSLLVVDGRVRVVNIAAAADDPSGDDRPEVALVDKMVADLEALAAEATQA
mmetsp:Transcript_114059/g.318564  ORF Transcript_114059/g.318564 Transcript_114059/m.318564 type:complete len:108 (+) Transcript_114059:340-663(+)